MRKKFLGPRSHETQKASGRGSRDPSRGGPKGKKGVRNRRGTLRISEASARPRPPRGTTTRWRRVLRWCSAALVLAGVIAGFVAYRVDARVKRRLANLANPALPAIYSAPLDLGGYLTRLTDGDTSPVKKLLVSRKYTEVNEAAPTRPGEFAIKGEKLTIVSREFQTAAGESIPSRRFSVSLKSGLPLDRQETGSAPLLLEPEAISLLGSGEVRASTFTPLSKIPKQMQNAVLAIEDERFFSHFGLDLIGLTRAIFTNIRSASLVQGGSTLTQQLAKNLILSPRRTLGRKLLEIPAALSLERHLSKEQLLELYLNEVYLGQEGAIALHGVPEAATAFFGKKLEHLTLGESATLAGMIKAPSVFSPRKRPLKTRERRNVVLTKMRELGFVSEDELQGALREPMKTVPHTRHRRVAPYFVASLERELQRSFDLTAARSLGLSVYTGIDLGVQRCAEEAVSKGIDRILKTHPKLSRSGARLQASLVALEPYSGLVKAWVGGRDFGRSQFDRVIQGKRQIGSVVKPFLYLTALDGTLNSYKVATAASILEDKPMEVTQRRNVSWVPENYDHTFRGDVTLREALEDSLNMPAVYVAQRVGIPAIRRTLERFHFGPLPNVPAVALGAVDASLLQATAAYGALANNGVYVQPRMFISALDEDGERLSTSEIREETVSDENATFVLSGILEGVLQRGTGTGARSAGFTRPAAGKTGTSDDARDAWFVGYTPNFVAGVWVGLDDNSPLGLTGGGVAAPIWGEFMRCSSPYINRSEFIPPPRVTTLSVDVGSGSIASPNCPPERVKTEHFVVGTEPQTLCPLHQGHDRSRVSDEPDSYALTQERDGYRQPRLPKSDEDVDELGQGSPTKRRSTSFWESLFGP